jgi:hypothetical protein
VIGEILLLAPHDGKGRGKPQGFERFKEIKGVPWKMRIRE